MLECSFEDNKCRSYQGIALSQGNSLEQVKHIQRIIIRTGGMAEAIIKIG